VKRKNGSIKYAEEDYQESVKNISHSKVFMVINDMACKKKKMDNDFKDDISRENKKFEELVKDVLKIHDELLEMGLEEIAEDTLEIHNKLLGKNEKEAKQDIDKQIKKLEKLKAESIRRLKIEMGTKNVSDDTLILLIESIAKNFDEQINSLKKTVL
jgi:hypothetical protein